MSSISIIRERGQITIPDKIRATLDWLTPTSPVSISIVNPDEISIRPYQNKKITDWQKLWAQIRKSRALKSKGQGNLSAFIIEDRQTRR